MTDKDAPSVPAPTENFVLQGWVGRLPWKQQSILLSGLRGPDQAFLPKVKQVSKWMRFVSQNNADPSKPYMNEIDLPSPSALDKELEHSFCHFVHHFADALAVIAYGHPDDDVRRTAYGFYYFIAEELFHFIPEPPEVFRWRHRDKRNGLDPAPAKPFDDRPWVFSLLPDDFQHDHSVQVMSR